MEYGYFDNAKKEYVITNPQTPVKWINYIGTLEFGGFVDHTGGALLCKGDPAQNRIVKYIQQMPSSEFKGTTLYIRIKQENGYKIFSPFYVPTLDKFDLYECHVGLGYSQIISEFYGIRTEVTIFIPRGDLVEIRDVKISNLSGENLEIDIIPVVEYSHPDALQQFTNADWIPQTMQSKVYDNGNGMKILTQFPFMNRDRSINFLTSNYAVSSFQSERKKFLGRNEYGTWARPGDLENDELGNYEALRGDNIAALMHHLGEMKKNDTKRIIILFGKEKNIEQVRNRIEPYLDENGVDNAFNNLAEFWNEYLGKMQVNTPDESMNHMLNVHNQHQCYITKSWSRYLSYYQMGLGRRGIGFRDSCQDSLAVFASAPDEAKELLKKLLHIFRRDGSAYHQMNPLSMEASKGEAGDEYGVSDVEYYGDDHLWMILAVCEYLKETGDYAFLDEVFPYYDKDESGNIEQGTVLDHMERAIEFTTNGTGAHGLPLLGFADWNDSVNLPGKAESLFVANQCGKALLEMIELAEYRSDENSAKKYKEYYDRLKKLVNEHAWDGEWYIRYFDADGNPLGSSKNEKCKIYMNAQSWPVISGFATEQRAKVALESACKILNTENGLKISTPGYNGYDEKIGGVTTYPPGVKENCAIFLHPNPWAMIAECIAGNGERAFQYYNQINPAEKNGKIDEFEVEPYTYPENILADEHPQFGLGRNSWLTGTASWMYLAGSQYILGIRPEHTGLRIDPCIPKKWNGFTVTRVYRNATYNIKVENPDSVSKGIRTITVDGKEIEGNIVPIFNDGKNHEILAVMG